MIAYADAIKANLGKVIDDLTKHPELFSKHPELFSKHPETDFTRDRKIPVNHVLRFPILMERDSVDMELLKYFDYDLDAVPTQSAYIQQRSKLAPCTFKMILDRFIKTLHSIQYKNKYVLYGVDGSGFNIFFNPDDPDTYNPPSGKSKRRNNEIHVVASYRLTDHIFTDAVIQPCKKKNEYSAICTLIDSCTFDGGTPIFLADRGFPSYNMFAHAKETGVFFLVRAKDIYMERLLRDDRPFDQDEFDVTVDRIVTRSHSKSKRSRPESGEIHRYVDNKTGFDYIEPGSKDEYPPRLRVVRVKIADGVYENPITNLPADEFDMNEHPTVSSPKERSAPNCYYSDH